jgi:hypothetical protein
MTARKPPRWHLKHDRPPWRQYQYRHQVNTKISARDQMLFDIFITALWRRHQLLVIVQEYHWMNADGSEDIQASALIAEEDGEDQVPHTIDRSVVAKGYSAGTTEWRNRLAWSASSRPGGHRGQRLDCDAYDADMVVSLACSGPWSTGE